MNRFFVCGDIGGTKILLCLGELVDNKIHIHLEHQYHSSSFTNFSEVLRDFLSKAKVVTKKCNPIAACFAVAGSIVAQRANLTNLPWLIDAIKITEEFSIPTVKLINDFEAAALSIDDLLENDLVTLQIGNPQAQSMRVVLGAGTGMGVAWLTWREKFYIPLSTEAGHIDFAPSSTLQDDFLVYQRKKFGHVSIERVLSGSGLIDIFNFLQAELINDNQLIQTDINNIDAPMVTNLALNRKHPIAVKALDLFVEIYGSYAGNLALAGLCHGGVYVAGGIAPKIIDKLKEGNFIRLFCDKGRYSNMMKDIPVHVVMNPMIGVMGAMREMQRTQGC
ncbi:MAG: glucokinase [Nitrosomonadales bacterium]|nr:MAG: glucokinase [Nitrosomonadales bacterium]